MNEKNSEQKNEIDVKLPSLQEMIEAGVHLGHKTSRWHPRMEPYIFSIKNGVHIFDLEKTLKKLSEAIIFLARIVSRGGLIVFAGSKPAARTIIKSIAGELGYPFVAERWIGGTLTNFKTINKRLQHLTNLEEQQRVGQWDKFTKKEQLELRRETEKMQARFAGIRNLVRLPEAVLVADVKADNIAVREAKKIKIPVVAVCDTDADSSLIDYVIPANDDASSSLAIIMKTIAVNLKNVKPAAEQIN